MSLECTLTSAFLHFSTGRFLSMSQKLLYFFTDRFSLSPGNEVGTTRCLKKPWTDSLIFRNVGISLFSTNVDTKNEINITFYKIKNVRTSPIASSVRRRKKIAQLCALAMDKIKPDTQAFLCSTWRENLGRDQSTSWINKDVCPWVKFLPGISKQTFNGLRTPRTAKTRNNPRPNTKLFTKS